MIDDLIFKKKESADFSTDSKNTNDEKKFFNNITAKTVQYYVN